MDANELYGDYLAKEWEIVSKADVEKLKELMATQGMSSVKSYMETKLEGWKSQPLNCAITGSSGTGKSSLINAIRNLKADNESAAEVGVTETTDEPTPYQDPANPSLRYWDLPGVGTPKYPKDETYLQKVDFERYDFFLIVCAKRFSENDIWLAMQIKKANKCFYFVRTKLDEDLRNEKRDHPSTFDEEDVKEKIRRNCIEELKKEGEFIDPKVFLISNCHQQKYEFSALCLQLIAALPQLKKEALTLSLHSFSNEMVVQKRKILQKRVWWSSVSSAVGALVPIPGISLFVDTALILHELNFYKHQFGLDDESLTELSRRAKSGLGRIMKTKSVTDIGTKENLLHLLRSYSQSICAEEATRYIVGIGWLIASAISFATTYRMLQDQLNRLETASHDIMALTLETMVSEED